METKFNNNKKVLGFIYVVISAVCFSSKGVIIKIAYNEQIDALSLLMLRMLFSFPVYIAAFFLYKPDLNNKEDIQTKDYTLSIFLGLLGYYLSSLLDFYGLEYVSAGIERLILFIYPTMVAVLSVIFHKKKIMKPMLISLLMTYAGILLVVVYDLKINGTESVPGIIYIFTCAFTFAVYLVFSDKLVHKFGSVRYTSIVMIASSLGVFIHYLIVHPVTDLLQYGPNIYYPALILAIFGTVVPSYLMTDGIKKIGARNTAITATLGPVWTIIFANLVLSEPIYPVQIIGTALVVGGILVVNLYKDNTSQK